MEMASDILHNIQQAVFEYDIKAINTSIINLIEEVEMNEFFKLDEGINEILQLINIAMSNKDYLLLSDILQFELQPVLVDLR